MEQLRDYAWPGNVREIENLVERALIQSQIPGDSSLLMFDSLSPAQGDEPTVRKKTVNQNILPLNDVISKHIKRALQSAGGKVEGTNGAANALGIHPSTLRARMRKLGIPYGKQANNYPDSTP